MEIITYLNAEAFLERTQAMLERNEAVNSLMLGVVLRLKNYPERIKHPPYLAAVEDAGETIAAAIMTPPNNLVVYAAGAEYGGALKLIAEDLQVKKIMLPAVVGPSELARLFAQVWTESTGQPNKIKMRLRIFELREVVPPAPVAGTFRPATEADLELLTGWTQAFHDEADLPQGDGFSARELTLLNITAGTLFLWEAGKGPVPVAMAAKIRPTTHGASIGLVYTPPELRGKGYASAVVAALSQKLLEEGYNFCSLFTDLSNPTSNSIYQKIGYRPLSDFDEYEFYSGSDKT